MKHGKRILIYTLLILALLCACTQDSILTAHYTPQHYTLSVNDGKVVGYRDAAIAAYRNRYASLVDSYREETWNEGYETSFGTWHEGIGSRRSAPEAAQILKSKGNDLVVSGHNHTNCFCIDYDGMTYLFALKTGPA